jgi:peptidoglycan/LPS O-acetylase OafA/YrhL
VRPGPAARPLIPEVQILRGIAVLLVLFGHIQSVAAQHFPDPLLGLFARAGFAGVDVFFVISGYIIHTLFAGGRTDWRFFADRANRIFPLYWIYTLILVGGMIALGAVTMEPENGPDFWASFFLLPQWDPPILPVGWTLTHELYFYLVYGLWLSLPHRLKPWAAGIWALATLIVGGADDGFTPETKVVFSLFNLQFLAGALLAQYEFRLSRIRLVFPVLIAVFGTLSLVLIGLHSEAVVTDPRPRVALFGPLAVGVVGAMLTYVHGLRSTWLERIGDWSYSLYLSHLLVLTTVALVIARLVDDGPAGAFAYYGLGLAACVIWAAISFYLAERPLLRLGKRFTRRA